MVATETDKEIISKEIGESVKRGLFSEKKAVIFGCTIYARDIRDVLLNYGIQIIGFIDNNVQKTGKDCLGLRVYVPEEFLKTFRKNIIFIVCSKYNYEMTEQLKAIGYSTEYILDIPISESRNMTGDSLEIFDMESAQVELGYALYGKICTKYSQKFPVFICPYPGTGDIYMACMYLQKYLSQKEIRDFILLVVGKGCERVAKLFSILNVEIISQTDMQNILKAWEFLGDSVMKIKPLLYWGWRTKRYLYADKYPQITFTEMFLYDVYGFEYRVKERLPDRKKSSDFAGQLFKDLNLPKGKTVVIAPYAGSFESSVTMEQWKKLSDLLQEKGYSVCTNCFGEKEIPVPGTKAILFPYDEAVNVLEYAGSFIAVRSGLCDIASSAKCRMVIIYENGFNASRYEYFSLKKMGLNGEAIEKIYVDENTILNLADEWEEIENDGSGT